MKYFSNLDSIRSHPLPKWYDDCKLGIFIHWGLYSVPAFAPKSGQLGTIELDERWFANQSICRVVLQFSKDRARAEL